MYKTILNLISIQTLILMILGLPGDNSHAELNGNNFTLVDFPFIRVQSDSTKIDLVWQIEALMETKFNLLRSQEREGKYEIINSEPIEGMGSGYPGWWLYAYSDQNVQKDEQYFYKFQAIAKESTWELDTIIVAQAKFIPTQEEKEILNNFKLLTSGLERITMDNYEKKGLEWSPDGKYIVYGALDLRKKEKAKWGIYTVNLEDKTVQELVCNDYDNIYPSWSRDGARVLFTSGNSASLPLPGGWTSLSLVNFKDKRIKIVEKIENDTIMIGLGSLSPVNNRIAFVKSVWQRIKELQSAHIWVMNIDGTQAKPITFGYNSNEGEPKWSPDGEKIAFHRVTVFNRRTEDEHVERSLCTVNSDGSEAEEIISDYTGGGFSWSPDGKWIAYRYFGGPSLFSQIRVVSVSGGEPEILFQGLRCGEPAWSPDGKKMAIVIKEPFGEKGDIWLMDVPDSLQPQE